MANGTQIKMINSPSEIQKTYSTMITNVEFTYLVSVENALQTATALLLEEIGKRLRKNLYPAPKSIRFSLETMNLNVMLWAKLTWEDDD